MNGDEINILFDRLKAEEEDAWFSLREHMGILISSWARKEKIELDWVASEEGVMDHCSITTSVFVRFREELLAGVIDIGRFSDYKAAVFKYSQELLKDQFARFYRYMVAKDNTAWKRVNERLHIYAAKWLSEKNIRSETALDVYQESALTLFEKVTGNRLAFETSRALKSYYFRILELKTLESNRRAVVDGQRFPELDLGHLYKPVTEQRFEGDDQYFHIEKIMKDKLSHVEYHILKHYYFHGDKLNGIAKSLQLSNVNCRQKKHQALRKIAAAYAEIEWDKNHHKPK